MSHYLALNYILPSDTLLFFLIVFFSLLQMIISFQRMQTLFPVRLTIRTQYCAETKMFCPQAENFRFTFHKLLLTNHNISYISFFLLFAVVKVFL